MARKLAILARVRDLDLNDLRVFVRVVDRGGFAGAARELRVPTSTVSRTVARLETRVGARLLQRTSRSVRSTSEGQALYASVRDAVSALENAAHALEPATRTPKGILRVTAAGEIATAFLAEVVVGFGERYPLVHTELVVTNRAVNLVDEGIDIAVRAAGRLADSSLVAKKLGELDHGLYAAPRYIESHGAPATPAALRDHRCIVFRAQDFAKVWTLRRDGQSVEIAVRATMAADDFGYIRSVVLAGGGIALMPRLVCSNDERAGRLVRVLPAFTAKGAGLYIIYPSAAHVPARAAAFRNYVAAAFEAWRQRA